ncbi:MAG: SpoIIE family protein phosphatase [Dokdonella sp.]
MPISLELVLTAGPTLASTRWRLAGRLCIGRAQTCQLVLAEPRISREHAIIEAANGGWTLSDCGSRLGTQLNGVDLVSGMATPLHLADVIAIGSWRFRVEADTAVDGRGIDQRRDAAARIGVGGHLGNLAEQRLQLLLRCAGEVAAAATAQEIADTVAEYALAGSGYARAAVLWQADDEIELRSLRPVAAADATEFRFSRSLVASAAAGELTRIDTTRSLLTADRTEPFPVRRALCAPLMLDGKPVAFLYLDSSRAARHGHADAPTFCHALARLAALALANLRRLASEGARATLRADLDRARDVQRRFLPDDSAPIGGIRCALHLHPGRVVAGDIADVFALDGGGAVALLGDVSGAGLGAGLVMASVQSFLRAELSHHCDPARAVTRLNAHLHAQASRGSFVTLWLGVFDRAALSCRFVDAGHGHAILVRADSAAEPISTRGDIPLGIDPDALFHARTLALRPDDLIVLYSDGVVEQRAQDGEPFGREGLIDAVHRVMTPQAAIASALSALVDHAAQTPADDDVTLLALGWQGADDESVRA